PVKVGVVTLVALSVFETPESVAAVRSGGLGAAGGVLSTANVALGPAAGAPLPAVSVAVPAAREIPRAPSPVMPDSVTVRVVPVPETATVALAVPVRFSVTSPADRVLALKLASE